AGLPLLELHYDRRGALRSAASNGGPTFSYRIDGLGRRIAKINAAGALVERYLYDGLRIVGTVDASGSVSRYFYATRPNVPDLLVRDGQSYRIISDPVGSPLWVVKSDGTIVQTNTYDLWGKVTTVTAPGANFATIPFGF